MTSHPEPTIFPKPKLLIISEARWGKDTVAEIFTQHDFKCFQSSAFATERVMMPYFAAQGTPYPTAAACFADRVNHRAAWRKQIERYNQPTYRKMSLQMLVTGHDIYVGMRSRMEFTASRELYDRVIWIDASKRLPPEGSSSNELTAADADEILDNNGTLVELARNAEQLIARLLVMPVRCPDCQGDGYDLDSLNPATMNYGDCVLCGGRGQLSHSANENKG